MRGIESLEEAHGSHEEMFNFILLIKKKVMLTLIIMLLLEERAQTLF